MVKKWIQLDFESLALSFVTMAMKSTSFTARPTLDETEEIIVSFTPNANSMMTKNLKIPKISTITISLEDSDSVTKNTKGNQCSSACSVKTGIMTNASI